MTVRCEIPDALCQVAGDHRFVELEGTTVAEALIFLWSQHPKLLSRMLDRDGRLYPYLMLLHNEQKVTQTELATRPVRSGDRLEIVALAEGG